MLNYYYSIDFGDVSPLVWIILLVWTVILLCANFVIFAKAGEPWWKALIPFYNSYTEFKFSTGNGWLFLLCIIPCVGWIFSIWGLYKLARCFGYGGLFTIGLLFLQPIFTLILAFGNCQYQGYNN